MQGTAEGLEGKCRGAAGAGEPQGTAGKLQRDCRGFCRGTAGDCRWTAGDCRWTAGVLQGNCKGLQANCKGIAEGLQGTAGNCNFRAPQGDCRGLPALGAPGRLQGDFGIQQRSLAQNACSCTTAINGTRRIQNVGGGVPPKGVFNPPPKL